MYSITKLKKLDLVGYCKVAKILHVCGKDMSSRYDLHHWDNPYLKSLIIVLIRALKNDVFLIISKQKTVATFMTRVIDKTMHFEKLATIPTEAGKGIGSFCLNQIEGIAKESECKTITMEVYKYSDHAIMFYEHKGYKRIAEENSLKHVEIIMEKRI